MKPGVSRPNVSDRTMKPARFYCGVFLVTASGLMLQIVQTRILSVVLWYYLAFLVISIAMFGITAGTVWVYLWNGPGSAAPHPAFGA